MIAVVHAVVVAVVARAADVSTAVPTLSGLARCKEALDRARVAFVALPDYGWLEPLAVDGREDSATLYIYVNRKEIYQIVARRAPASSAPTGAGASSSS